MAVNGLVRSSYNSMGSALSEKQQARKFVVCYLKTLPFAKII